MDFTTNWHWPQWTLLAFLALVWLGRGLNHGLPRKADNGFVATFDFALVMALLIAGGFFK